MTEQQVLQVFRDTGALLEGHFVLRSGLHSRQYFQCALALQHMPTVEKLGAALAALGEKEQALALLRGGLDADPGDLSPEQLEGVQLQMRKLIEEMEGPPAPPLGSGKLS